MATDGNHGLPWVLLTGNKGGSDCRSLIPAGRRSSCGTWHAACSHREQWHWSPQRTRLRPRPQTGARYPPSGPPGPSMRVHVVAGRLCCRTNARRIPVTCRSRSLVGPRGARSVAVSILLESGKKHKVSPPAPLGESVTWVSAWHVRPSSLSSLHPPPSPLRMSWNPAPSEAHGSGQPHGQP